MDGTRTDKPKILIVDDLIDNLHAMMNILRDDYAVVAATGGENALKLAAREPRPDLMLLDLKMPGMDGYEVLHRLKANPETADIPVIIVTGLSESEDEAKGLKMGAVDYIAKPFNPDWLRLRVLTQLELRRYRRKPVLPRTSGGGGLQGQFSILVVDDVPENIHELISVLSDEYRIMVANNGPKAIELVQGPKPPDLILLDIVMPEMDGYEVCRRIKSTEAGNRIPVIFLSVVHESVEKVRGFGLGAADYITKPFDIDEVRARIRTHLELNLLQRFFEQTVAQRTASLQATLEHDFLTGLSNRMLLNDRIRQAIALAPRHKKKVALLFLDLDGFKHVNDSLGHPFGDKLLQSIAMRLVNCVRSTDTVSRQGGDEFVVLLTDVEQWKDAANLAEKLLKAVAQVHSIDQRDFFVTASIGVSIFPDDGQDAETLIKHADTAMYQAKENGRQRYQFFEPAMNVRAVERQSIEASLRHALEHREFALHYQPIINLTTGNISGAEALIRWMHPLRGPVPPGQFIPVAEDCGIIVPIGNWVLREACKQARAWVDAGLPLISMAVNISAMEFRREGFLEGVFAILDDTGLDPTTLVLELTESVLMKNVESTESILKRLKSRGVGLAVDDFGTGYSSLSYLRKFPIDALKIDQSFVRQITGTPCETTIVTAVISMSRNLKLRVVAEGVETQEELTFLRAYQCDEAQGFFLSRPVPAAQFTGLLENGLSDTPVTRLVTALPR